MLSKEVWVSVLVLPIVPNALKKTDRGCLPNVMIALEVQTLDDSCDCRESVGLLLLLKVQQVAREVSEDQIQQVAIVGWQTIRWAAMSIGMTSFLEIIATP